MYISICIYQLNKKSLKSSSIVDERIAEILTKITSQHKLAIYLFRSVKIHFPDITKLGFASKTFAFNKNPK